MKTVLGALACVLSWVVITTANAADVRVIRYSHLLDEPPGMEFTHFAKNVAIDGANIIVLATHAGGQSALWYQRASGAYRFTYRKTLITFPYPRENLQVRMANGIAVVHFGDRAWIFEQSGCTYVLGRTEAPLRHPGGVAISANRILFGGNNCDYDGVVYQKGGDGIWRITGRLDDNRGPCVADGLAVSLSYDHALIHTPLTHEVTAWRRNGAALDWVSAGNVAINAEVAASSAPFALYNATAVTPGSYVFRRSGNTWSAHGRVIPADSGMGTGSAQAVKYRDGVLITTEGHLPGNSPRPYVYLETTPGDFEHVAMLQLAYAIDYDVSGRTVVVAANYPTAQQAYVFVLPPEPIAAGTPIPADFDDGDTSDFTVVRGQFAVANRNGNGVFAQTDTSGLSLALAEDSDWTYYQSIEADITPVSSASDGWVGLVVRYVDANNYYYLAVREGAPSRLYRRLNGVDSLITEWSLPPGPKRIAVTVDDDEIDLSLNGERGGPGILIERSLPRGRAGLATFRAAADFDQVHVAAAGRTSLLSKRFVPDADVAAMHEGRDFNHIGGDWQYLGSYPTYLTGFQQRDASRSAFAWIGSPVRNQDIEVAFRINGVASHTNAWVGILGRYVDAQTHYYAILRNSNRLEIRKKVNGVVTLLGWTNYRVTSGAYHMLRFRIVEDQLQLWTGDEQFGWTRVLNVHDDEIPAGAHGLATYLAAATWDFMYVRQP